MTNTQYSRDFAGMARWRGARTGALLLGLAVGFAASIGPAQAEKVGVAAAVNPDAFSSLSSTPNKQLKIGKSIFYNERINTTASGLVQVLLLDGSTFTVGPNSDLVIDKFVYDPKKKTGQIIATFTKGTMRFIGGKLSKNAGGVTVNTPSGVLAIRGGMFQGNATRRIYSFLYGHSLTFRGRNGQTRTIYEPGYTLDLSRGTVNVRPTTSQDINAFMQALSSGGTNHGSGGGSPTNPGGSNALQQANNLQDGASELISNANATLIQDEIQNQINNQNNNNNNNNTQTGNTQTGNTQTGNNNPPPVQTVPLPEELAVRVLTAPDVYFATNYSSWQSLEEEEEEEEDWKRKKRWKKKIFVAEPGAHGILGGDDKLIDCEECDFDGQQVQTDDFTTTVDIADGRATGTFGPLIKRDGWKSYGLTPEEAYDFPIFNTPGVHSVTDAMAWDIGENGEQLDPVTLVGSAFTGRNGGFFAYQLFEQENGVTDLNDPILAFGGNTFTKPEGEADQLRLFNLYSDPRQGIDIPFAARLFAPDDLSQASVSPLYLLENSGNSVNPNGINNPNFNGDDHRPEHARRAPEPSVWVQTSYLVLGNGENQQSILVLALGTQNENGSLTGVRRGTAHLPGTFEYEDEEGDEHEIDLSETINLSGNIATLAGPDGRTHLFGKTTPAFVIGADSTGSHTVFKDEPLHQAEFAELFELRKSDFLGATYHIGEQIASIDLDTTTLAHNPGEFHGYAAGIYEQNVYEEDYEDSFGVLANATPDSVYLKFKDNRLEAFFGLEASEEGGAGFAFGDWDVGPSKNRTGHSAFISDNIYAATEANVPSFVFGGDDEDFDEPFAITNARIPFNAIEGGDFEDEDYDIRIAKASTYLVSGGLINPNAQLCDTCEFMKWGTWGGQLKFEDGEWESVTADINLGWYVAGDIPTLDELPTQGAATYAGSTIGNVATLQNDAWKTYLATGKVDMNWNFANRAGRFDITEFDKSAARPNGLAFGGPIAMPGSPTGPLNKFTGNLTGSNLTGGVTGSFVRRPGQLPGSVPAGAIGNWQAGNPTYRAGGIWGASQRP